MGFKKQKTSKKINLFDLPANEKTQLIKKMRAVLDNKIKAAKTWKTFLHYDTLIINGFIVYRKD